MLVAILLIIAPALLNSRHPLSEVILEDFVSNSKAKTGEFE